MDFSQQIFQYILSGLATGAIYALIGLGFAIIYNSTGIINFAQGEFVMLGGMFGVYFHVIHHFNLAIALLLAVVCAAIAGVLFERLAIRPLRRPTQLGLVIITIGGSILVRGIAMLVWGKDTHALPTFSGDEPLTLAGATLLPQHLWIFALTVLLIVVNKLFFQFTITGKALRACAVNQRAAGLVGIDVRRMVMFSFLLASGMGALAGIIIAPLTMTSYDVGIMLGLKGFCAAIVGGMSNGIGTVLGGLILGVLEALGAGLISSGYKDAVTFIILLLILFLRPHGLFSRGESERV